MAITFDSAYSGAASGDTVLFNATVAEENSIMLLFNSNTAAGTVYDTATVRFPTSGTDATFIGQTVDGSRAIGCWYILNPEVGTHQVEMAFSVNFDKSGAVAIYKSARQSGQPDASAVDGSASEATRNLGVTVDKNNSWIVAGWAMSNGTPSSGTTERVAQADTGSGVTLYVGDSDGSKSSGAQSLEYSGTATGWAGIIVSIAPVQGFKKNGFAVSLVNTIDGIEVGSINSLNGIE